MDYNICISLSHSTAKTHPMPQVHAWVCNNLQPLYLHASDQGITTAYWPAPRYIYPDQGAAIKFRNITRLSVSNTHNYKVWCTVSHITPLVHLNEVYDREIYPPCSYELWSVHLNKVYDKVHSPSHSALLFGCFQWGEIWKAPLPPLPTHCAHIAHSLGPTVKA